MTNMTASKKKTRLGRLASVLAPIGAVALGACSSLLDVDLPGNATEDDLNTPLLAETLVTSVVGDFECGFVDYMRFPGQWFEEFVNSSQSRPDALVGLRSALTTVYADPCASGTGPLYTPLQVPRQQAKRAISLIKEFNPAAVNGKGFLIAKARVYEAFSIQLLAEQFCAVTFDGGPEISRVAAYDSAEVKFSEAIDSLTSSITQGVRTTEATALRNAARVGRARSRLYQWQYAGGDALDVISDASAVTANFKIDATYDATPTRRRNRIYEVNNVSNAMMPNRSYTGLRLDAQGRHVQAPTAGTADPRVSVTVSTTKDDPRGFTKLRTQNKYSARNSPITFASWREAQLMIAEVSDRATMVNKINLLRSTTTGAPSGVTLSVLTPFNDSGLTDAQVRQALWEERRRELWMQGQLAGDKQRWGYPAWETQDEYGLNLGAGGCIPVPYLETISNPNYTG